LTGEKDAGKACAHLTARSLTGIDARVAATRELVVADHAAGLRSVAIQISDQLHRSTMRERRRQDEPTALGFSVQCHALFLGQKWRTLCGLTHKAADLDRWPSASTPSCADR
jgi:hypothetical protein